MGLTRNATEGAGRGVSLKGYQTPVRNEVFRPEAPPARRDFTRAADSTPWNRREPGQLQRGRNRLFPWDVVDIRTDLEAPLAFSVYRPIIRADRADIDNAVTVTIDGGDFVPEADAYLVAEITAIPVTAVTVKLITEATWSAAAFYPSCYEFNSGPGYTFKKAWIPLWRFYDADAEYPGGRVVLGEPEDEVYGEKLVPDGPLQVVYTIAEVTGQNRVRAVPDLV